MISNHVGFIEALRLRRKISVRFYSAADSGILDRVCAPLAYGPGADSKDGLNLYWIWDYAAAPNPCAVGLVPQQIVELQLLGEHFDPALLVPAQPVPPPAPAGPTPASPPADPPPTGPPGA